MPAGKFDRIAHEGAVDRVEELVGNVAEIGLLFFVLGGARAGVGGEFLERGDAPLGAELQTARDGGGFEHDFVAIGPAVGGDGGDERFVLVRGVDLDVNVGDHAEKLFRFPAVLFGIFNLQLSALGTGEEEQEVIQHRSDTFDHLGA